MRKLVLELFLKFSGKYCCQNLVITYEVTEPETVRFMVFLFGHGSVMSAA